MTWPRLTDVRLAAVEDRRLAQPQTPAQLLIRRSTNLANVKTSASETPRQIKTVFAHMIALSERC
jgi:hypothetical protein